MSETVLLVGGGGREHAIARSVADSEQDVELYAAASNKNPGIAELAAGFVTVDETDAESIVTHSDARPGDIDHSEADIDRARSELGYEPTTPLRDGIRALVEEPVISSSS